LEKELDKLYKISDEKGETDEEFNHRLDIEAELK